MSGPSSLPTLSTCDLGDRHKAAPAGSLRVLPPVFQHFGARRAFAGPVQTVQCFEDNTSVKALLESPGEGRVLVVAGGGALARALLGGNIAASAARQGWAGVVIDGAMRDRAELAAAEVGLCALALTPLPTDRRQPGRVGEAVMIQGVPVAPGDWLVADEDGLVVLSAAQAAEAGLHAARA